MSKKKPLFGDPDRERDGREYAEQQMWFIHNFDQEGDFLFTKLAELAAVVADVKKKTQQAKRHG